MVSSLKNGILTMAMAMAMAMAMDTAMAMKRIIEIKLCF